MEISDYTKNLLVKMADINDTIRLKPGENKLVVASNSESLLVIAEIEESWPVDCILRNYAQIFKIFSNPDIKFKENHAKITQGRFSQQFRYSHPSIAPREPKIDLDEIDAEIEFSLSGEDLKALLQAAKVTGANAINFENGKISAIGTDDCDGSVNPFTIESEELKADGELNVLVELDLFKMSVDDDYTVNISVNSDVPLVMFKKKVDDGDQKLTYITAMLPESYYKRG
jgi:hypothetical protein